MRNDLVRGMLSLAVGELVSEGIHCSDVVIL